MPEALLQTQQHPGGEVSKLDPSQPDVLGRLPSGLRQSRTGFRMQNLPVMGRAFILGPVDGFSTWLMPRGALWHRDFITAQEETPWAAASPGHLQS